MQKINAPLCSPLPLSIRCIYLLGIITQKMMAVMMRKGPSKVMRYTAIQTSFIGRFGFRSSRTLKLYSFRSSLWKLNQALWIKFYMLEQGKLVSFIQRNDPISFRLPRIYVWPPTYPVTRALNRSCGSWPARNSIATLPPFRWPIHRWWITIFIGTYITFSYSKIKTSIHSYNFFATQFFFSFSPSTTTRHVQMHSHTLRFNLHAVGPGTGFRTRRAIAVTRTHSQMTAYGFSIGVSRDTGTSKKRKKIIVSR